MKPLPIATARPDSRADLAGWAAHAREKLAGRPVIVSVSGGKDSLGLGLLLLEAGIPFTCVHFDTGWEHEITEGYVRDYLPTVLGPVRIIQGKYGGMEDLVRAKGMFPSRRKRFCTEELKIFPFRDYLKGLDDEPVSAVGIRSQESASRSKLGEWEWSDTYDCWVWRPLIDWTYADVIAIHLRHGVTPNPLYTEKGFTRVGCYPCIFARKVEIRAIADQDPERIDRLERLEQEMADRHPADSDRGPPTFFQDPRVRTNKAKGIVARVSVPIREVVAWSRTHHGGKQLDMFTPDYAQEGCTRWGLCEAPESEA